MLTRQRQSAGAATARVLATFVLVLATGCSPTEPNESAACLQPTQGFGNFGCTVISGRVLDSAGQPVTNVSVGPAQAEDAEQFNTPYARTGLDGKFTIRLTRYQSAPSDSATLWIRAVKVPQPSDVVSIRDSVRVRVRVAAIGEIPDTTYLDLVLPIP